jgi:flagellar motor switch protein FliM
MAQTPILGQGKKDAPRKERFLSGDKIKAYDFAHPDKFSKEQMRALELIYTNSSRHLTTQLSALFRSSLDIDLESISETSYQKFFDSMPNSASLALISIEPLSGRALLEIDPKISFAWIDRLLGGPGRSIEKIRDLTEIEKTLITRVYERISKVIADSWATVTTIKTHLDMIIGSAFFSQVGLPDDRVVLARFAVKYGALTGALNFSIPVTALDPVLSKLNAQQWFAAGHRANSPVLSQAVQHSLRATDVEAVVVLGKTDVATKDLLELQVGDLIRLDGKSSDDLEMKVGRETLFKGQAGRLGNRLGFRITQVVKEED